MQPRAKVLIIDDNGDLRAILGELLCAEFDVATAATGEDGVVLATSFRPDLVILDLQLPQMDGIEAGLLIRREVETVRILVLTASSGAAAEILASGCCDAYMAKPAPLAAIRERVDVLLSGTEAAA